MAAAEPSASTWNKTSSAASTRNAPPRATSSTSGPILRKCPYATRHSTWSKPSTSNPRPAQQRRGTVKERLTSTLAKIRRTDLLTVRAETTTSTVQKPPSSRRRQLTLIVTSETRWFGDDLSLARFQL